MDSKGQVIGSGERTENMTKRTIIHISFSSHLQVMNNVREMDLEVLSSISIVTLCSVMKTEQ